MKRPALLVGFPFVLGLVLASCTGERLLVCGGLVLAAAVLLYRRRELWKYILLGTLSCLTACCVYWQKEAATLGRQMQFAGCETTFTGEITELTTYSSGYGRYYLNGMLDKSVPAKIELFCARTDLAYGDTVTLSGIPTLPESGYLSDAEQFAKAKCVFLTFSMPGIMEVKPLERQTLRSVIYRWRIRMTERILDVMGQETGGMLTGMLFGDKSGMDRSTKTALYRMGLGHVLAVSGLHLDVLALCASFLLTKWGTDRKLAFVLMTVLSGMFVICAGETVSVKRACIMLLLRESGKVVFRRADALNSLSIAAFLLGVENPFVIHSAAFWLSCTAAYGISVLAPYMTREMPAETFFQTLKKSVLMSCWVFLAILPACAVFFREVSLLSPVSNTLLVPVCMLSMLLGTAALLFGAKGFLAELLLRCAGLLNTAVLEISRKIAMLPWVSVATGRSLLVQLLLAGVLLAVGIFLLARDKVTLRRTILAVLVLTFLLTGTEQSIRNSSLHVAVLGEGKNCILVLNAGDEAVVLDMAGTSGMAAYADAYLTENGVHRLETLYLCKPSARSAARYSEYLSFLPPEQVWLLREAWIPSVLGYSVQTAEHREQLFHGARITAEADSVTVEYAGMTLVCTKEAALPEEEPEVLVVYGRNRKPLLPSGVLIVLDAESDYLQDGHTYIGENNLELTIAKDGTCRVRRLYGNT